MDRRMVAALVCAILLAGCAGKAPQVQPPQPAPAQQPPVSQQKGPAAYDLVIKGGTVYDGTGAPGVKGDVAVVGEKIVAVGSLGAYTAKAEIDATGLAVAPGFINPHSHTHDFINPFEDLDATASLMQGITTEFGGVDGRSPLPIGQELKRFDTEGTGVNFGLFVGQGSIRGKVMGDAPGPASADQLAAMKRLARTGMEEGAFGVSTGLEYMPGRQADAAEITALVAEAKPFGGIYSTHMRSEGDRIAEALDEALSIAKNAGVPLNISHFKIVGYGNWGKEAQVVARVEQAIKDGQRVVADVYPYLAPDYAVDRKPSEWYGRMPLQYLLIIRAKDPAMVGKTLADVAKDTAAVDRLTAADPSLSVVALLNSEKAMVRFYQAPWSVVSTDGEAQPKRPLADYLAKGWYPHPRGYGSYPRLLGQYIREEQMLPMESMIRKMTGATADYLGLKDRGYLKAGDYADIVVFDPKTVADRTTWLAPQEYPAGIRQVLVNGQVAVRDGARQPGRPGKALRHEKP